MLKWLGSKTRSLGLDGIMLNRFLALSLCVLSTASVDADEFDLYFLGGQSNMEGFGSVEHLSESDRSTVPGAWIFQSTPTPDQRPIDGKGVWSQVQPGHGTSFTFDGTRNRLSNRFGVELSFAKAMRERRPGRKLAIIKYARNGSSIDPRAAGNWGCWEPNFLATSGEFRDINQYDQFLSTVRNALAIEDIDGDGERDRLRPAGILWMQGESDAAFSEAVADDYENNLKRLMDLVRAVLRSDGLPVVIGRISDSKKNTNDKVWKYGDRVREAQLQFTQRDRAARLVRDTDEYQYSDPWHYDSKGYLALGRRFAEGLLAIPKLPSGEMFEPGAKLTVEVGNGVGGEGPAWDAEWGVLSSGNGHIQRWSRERVSTIFREGAGTNGLVFDPQGRLLACEPKLRRVTRTDRLGNVTVLTERFDGKKYNTPNDIAIDSQGRIYFSDPRYGERESMEMSDNTGSLVEGVYRIDLDGTVHRVIGREVDRANGVLVTKDDRYLLVADNNNNTLSGSRKLWRFELRPDGTIVKESARNLFDWGKGRGPDGLKQDEEGNLYVAAGLNRSHPPFEPDDQVKAGIYVLTLDGELLDFLSVPTDEVTNCAFGGDDGKTLYITGGGTLYSIRTKYAGRTVRKR